MPDKKWNDWNKYYPGDAFVDWVGISAYNWGTTRAWSSWRPFKKLIKPVYDDYRTRKPVMIAETASAEQGSNKARWIRNARRIMQKPHFTGIRAFVWFHMDKESDWRINSSARALRAFRNLAQDPSFTRRERAR